MKARLLIGVLTCAIMLAILATVGGVAKADDPGGLTCGGSVTSGTAYHNDSGDVWNFADHHNCNLGKTYSVEIQYDLTGSLTTWHDWGATDKTRASGSCSSGCTVLYSETGQGCGMSVANYRLKFWWNGGSIAGPGRTAAAVCTSNGVLLSAP